MANPVAIVESVVGVALSIAETVETVRENKDECRQVETRARRVRDVVLRLGESAGTMEDKLLADALQDLGETLRSAHALVRSCRSRSAVCRYGRARKVAKKLRKAHEDISHKMMLAMWVTTVCIPPAKDRHHSPYLWLFVPVEGSSPPRAGAGAAADAAVPAARYEEPHRQPPRRPPPRAGARAEDDAAVPEVRYEEPRHQLPRRPPPRRRARCCRCRCPCVLLFKSSETMHDLPDDYHIPTRPRIRPSIENQFADFDVDRRTSAYIERYHRMFESDEEPIGTKTPSFSMPKRDEQPEGIKMPSPGKPSPPLPGLTKFSWSELEVATDGFSMGNIIGRGGSGSTVFKGALWPDKHVVAIKKFQDPPKSLVARICDELHLASELQRKKEKNNNIIRILGYGHKVIKMHEVAENHIFIIEEYMAGGNMADIIYGSRYDWSSRFRMIQGIANGINYLHEQQILYLDLKPSNILLDTEMNPKITGLRRARKMNKTTIHEDGIVGTVGYMPPEYILEGTLSMKYDVYSFGVTLLETISGMFRPEPARQQASIEWAWEAHESGRMGEPHDPSMCDGAQLQTEVTRCMQVGLLCVQEKPEDRPTMPDVLRMFKREKDPTKPIRPEYTTKMRSRTTRNDGPFNKKCF